MEIRIQGTRSVQAGSAVMGLIVAGLVVCSPIAVADETSSSGAAPALCSSEEEKAGDADVARCHARRAASAAYRTREAAEYAEAQRGNKVADIDFALMKRRVEGARESADQAAKAAESKDAQTAASLAASASGTAFAAAHETAKMLGGYGNIPNPKGGPDYVGYFGPHGDAAVAARHAYKRADFGRRNHGLDISDNTLADEAEAKAVDAFRTAGWIVR
ncbi:hypothetical protein [Nocardia sp. CS682]|uniref:hypothetical protein n=1 Tax=Nocardia sp. CS682 TaxID=1047172 RepID=UPI001075845B|nr:hypothetical protein [Nocardia sp. CS682]